VLAHHLYQKRNQKHSATFILSIGRCGTQWLASVFRKLYEDVLYVEHEPLHLAYQPRKTYGLQQFSNNNIPEAVKSHLADIKHTLKEKPYLECGWPCWGALRYFAQALEGRIRIIHLVRHPVYSSFSWLTHQAFCPPLLPHLGEGKVFLTPFDNGVVFKNFCDVWEQMSPLEKNFFYWAEINGFGICLEEEYSFPFLRINFEELFQPSSLKKITSFLDLAWKETLYDYAGKREDKFSGGIVDSANDPELIFKYKDVIDVAQQLGYNDLTVDAQRLMQRYYCGVV